MKGGNLVIKEIWSWTKSLAFAIVLAMLISIFVFQPYKVEGHSMDPTLHDQERIFVSKLSHTFSYLPNYGDIVVIDSRIDRERTIKDDVLDNPLITFFSTDTGDHMFYVKRVIGKPGDKIEIKDHKVLLNGKPLDEPYIKEAMDEESSDQTWVVPDNHIFVMGDNRNNSRDSREIGFVPMNHIMGAKVFGF